MKYAVIALGGQQYQVQEGQEIVVNKLDGQPGNHLAIDRILLTVNDGQKVLGRPIVPKASIKAKILNQYQGKKIRVATYKAKARYRKTKGFRPQLTKLIIENINVS